MHKRGMYSAGDEDIDLVPLEEFYAHAPEGVSRPEVTRTNEHEQRLARLTWEIAQRKALVDTLTEQEGRRNVLISSINGKEQRLKNTSLHVVIRGDASEALRLNRQQKEETEEKERSDDEETSDNDERHSVVSDRLELNKKAVTQPHPIYLKIDIGCHDDVKVALKLFYLPELRVTCMKYKVTGKLPTHGIGVDSFASKYGRPYRFVQALTGSASLPGGDSTSKNSGAQPLALTKLAKCTGIDLRRLFVVEWERE
ncbi:hypothetical protein COOONC_16508 [Cooperia oncophora]